MNAHSAIGARVWFPASARADDIAYGIVVSESAFTVRASVAPGDVRTVRADLARVVTMAPYVTPGMRATHGAL